MPHDPDAPETQKIPASLAPTAQTDSSTQKGIQQPQKLLLLHIVLISINVILAFILSYQLEWQNPFIISASFSVVLVLIERVLTYEQLIEKIANKFPHWNIYGISTFFLIFVLVIQIWCLFCNPGQTFCPRPTITPTPTPSPTPPPTFTPSPTPEPTHTPAPTTTPPPTLTPPPYTVTVIMTLADSMGQPILPYTNGSYFTPHLMCGDTNHTYEELVAAGAIHFYQISSTSILQTIDVEVIGKEATDQPQRFLIRTKRPTSVFKLDNVPDDSSDSCYFWLIQTAGFGLLNLAENEIERLEPYDCRDLMGRDFCP